MSRIMFHRPARVVPPQLPTEPVVLAAPPQPVGKDTGANWLILLMPLLSSISMAAYLMSGGKKVLILLGICFVVLSIGVTFGIRLQMRRSARRDKVKARDRYLAHLVEVRRAAHRVAEDQRAVAAWAYPSPYRLWAIATQRRRVWERRVSDPDFLHVCVGVGKAPLSTPIRLATRNDPTVEYDARAKAAADRLIAQMSTVGSQPAVVDLARAGVVSVLGPSAVARGVARAMLCQIGVMHAPDDVAVAVVTGGEEWDWAKWLPHTHEPEARGDAGVVPLVAEDFEGIADHLQAALERAGEQPAVRRSVLDRQAPDTRRRLVVVLDGYDPRAAWARSPLATELLAAAGQHSAITVICIVERENDEPTRADVRVRVGGDGALTLEGRQAGQNAQVTDVLAEWPEPALCEATARALAPLRLSVEGEEILAQVMSLPQMLGISDLDSFEPENLWVEAEDEGVLRMPLGFDGNGQPLLLDLKEAAQGGMGPHGLVVGATGSGKSELLRTLVLGLALTHSSETLNFVLVDFKGGATFLGLDELPHVSAVITNLADEASLVSRMRDALHGELMRRQELLRAAGNYTSVLEYEKARAAGTPLEPLPSLFVVVDEFSELLAAHRDFMELFVMIGRLGRSLGVHLLLASQRLDEGRMHQLEIHLSYRIGLRTFSAMESRGVLGVPDAHQLPPQPGSGFLKTGVEALTRFRAAYSSGSYRRRGKADQARVASQVVPWSAARVAPVEPPAPDDNEQEEPEDTGETLLSVAVDRMRDAGPPAHQVWLPPLDLPATLDQVLPPLAPDVALGLTTVDWEGRGGLTVPVGIIDRPFEQLRDLLVVDLSGAGGHVAMAGGPQSGKSTLVRTLITALALTHTPREVQFYCLDFGGGTLAGLSGLPHVAGVAARLDQERVGRTIAEVTTLLADREQFFLTHGIDSMATYRRRRAAGQFPDQPHGDVFLIVDGWSTVRQDFDRYVPTFNAIAARGLNYGIHLIVTTARWVELSAAVRDQAATHLELRMGDPMDSEINARQAASVPRVPGRGITRDSKLHFLTALPRIDSVEGSADLADGIAGMVAAVRESWTGPPAPQVRMLPARLSTRDLPAPEGDFRVPIGLEEDRLSPVWHDFGESPHMVVVGDTECGKTNLLRLVAKAITERYTPEEARIMVVDYRRELIEAVPDAYRLGHAIGMDALKELVDGAGRAIKARVPGPDIAPARMRLCD
ncbi:MAG: segregation ATPase FtsK/SpoIIIE, family, partial [Streptosporangiaceae bacterium]|nr:segregation ATPase FtsK/SpoIIIE, family [Streptosporangiaceae bacterium]